MKGFHPTSMIDHMTKSLKTNGNDMSKIMKSVCFQWEYIQVWRQNTPQIFISNVIIIERGETATVIFKISVEHLNPSLASKTWPLAQYNNPL